jgi:hypothetical protein
MSGGDTLPVLIWVSRTWYTLRWTGDMSTLHLSVGGLGVILPRSDSLEVLFDHARHLPIGLVQ